MSTQWPGKIMIALLALPFFGCSFLTPAPTPSAADIEKEEQAVYAFFAGGGNRTVLILEETSTNVGETDPKETVKFVKEGLKGITSETIKSYLSRNEKPTLLSADMDLGVDYTLISMEELAQITKQSNWGEVMSQKYPGSSGYLILSRVGFNRTLDQALIYVGEVRGPLMGNGDYYLMEKKDGEWRMMEQVGVWIS